MFSRSSNPLVILRQPRHNYTSAPKPLSQTLLLLLYMVRGAYGSWMCSMFYADGPRSVTGTVEHGPLRHPPDTPIVHPSSPVDSGAVPTDVPTTPHAVEAVETNNTVCGPSDPIPAPTPSPKHTPRKNPESKPPKRTLTNAALKMLDGGPSPPLVLSLHPTNNHGLSFHRLLRDCHPQSQYDPMRDARDPSQRAPRRRAVHGEAGPQVLQEAARRGTVRGAEDGPDGRWGGGRRASVSARRGRGGRAKVGCVVGLTRAMV